LRFYSGARIQAFHFSIHGITFYAKTE